MSLNNYSVWTALVTPFMPDGKIDFTSLEALVMEQEKANNGIVLFGSTGEGLALNVEEKQAILTFVAKLSIKVPLMVAVGGFRLDEQLAWIDFCESNAKIDAFLVVTPMYAKPGPVGQYNWFKEILDATHVPCMLYNVPGRTSVKLYPEVIERLKKHPNLWAMKEASGNIEDFKTYQKANSALVMYSGDDALVPELVALGAKGVVSIASNVWPDAVHLFVNLCLQGKDPGFSDWKDASNSMMLSSNPIPVKVLLFEKQRMKSSMLRPPLSSEDLSAAKLQVLLKQNEAVNAWYHQQKG